MSCSRCASPASTSSSGSISRFSPVSSIRGLRGFRCSKSTTRGLVREFSDALREELDYGQEAAHARFFRDLFSKEPGFKIPQVIEEYSKNRVLTQERVCGRNVMAAGQPDASRTATLRGPEGRKTSAGDRHSNGRRRGPSRPVERRTTAAADRALKAHLAAVSHSIARFVLEPAFEHGVFYADPHPGNLLIQDDGSLAVVDFGKVGRLTPEVRRRVADMFVAMARGDAQRLTDRLVDITAPTHPIERAVLTHQVDRMLGKYVEVSLDHIHIGDATEELLRLVREHSLRVPGNLVQFFKALAMCEGIMLAIDPRSRFVDYLQPMLGKLVYQQFAGAQSLERLRDSAIDAAALGIELPGRLDRVLGEIERGNLRVWTRIEDIEPLMKRFEHLVECSNATILSAACIVALAVLMQIHQPTGWQAWIGAVFWIAGTGAVLASVRTLWALRK